MRGTVGKKCHFGEAQAWALAARHLPNFPTPMRGFKSVPFRLSQGLAGDFFTNCLAVNYYKKQNTVYRGSPTMVE